MRRCMGLSPGGARKRGTHLRRDFESLAHPPAYSIRRASGRGADLGPSVGHLIVLSTALPVYSRPIFGPVGLRFVHDCDIRPAVGFGHIREFFRFIATRQNLPQSAVNVVARELRRTVECFRINQIAQRITEHPLFEVELAQAPSLGIARAPRGEFPGEAARSLHADRRGNARSARLISRRGCAPQAMFVRRLPLRLRRATARGACLLL